MTSRGFSYWASMLMLGSVLAAGPSAWGLAAAADARREQAIRLPEQVVAEVGTPHGVLAVLGCERPELLRQLAEGSEFLIHALDPDARRVHAAREVVDGAGLYGARVVVEHSALKRLPHADGLLDAVFVLPSALEAPCVQAHQELTRVLRPGGVALLARELRGKDGSNVRLERIEKPPVSGVDDWSHWEHGPDNNPVSTDQVIRYPYMTQWMARPLYIAMPAITTAAGGRLFLATGHIAHHRREEPWLNTLLARNGHNGQILWKQKFPDGYLAHRSAFVATDEAFYMIDFDGEGCRILQPETGEEIGLIDLAEYPGQWKWIAIADGVLYALIGEEKDPAETTIVRSQHHAWSWGELSRGYYRKRVPWGFGRRIVAYDLVGKRTRWAYEDQAQIDSRAMAVGGGHVCFYAPASHLGRLDAKTGRRLWTNADSKTRELIEERGRGLGSTPGFRSMCYCLWTPKALFFEAQTRMNIVAVSHEDGRRLWHRRKTTNNPNMLYTDGRLYVGIGKEGNTLVLDPLTGETRKDLGFRKRSCARLTATPDSLFCRGWIEGLTRYDRTSGKVLFNGALRPACNDGVIAANGLLYLGPWLCDCNLSLMGRVAWCSANGFDFQRKEDDGKRAPSGNGNDVRPLDVTEADWPTYRHDITRGAHTPVQTPNGIRRLWRTQTPRNEATAPVSAGRLVFFCDRNGRVTALDASTGKVRWTFLTAGAILQSPTIAAGRAYVGSGDGYVYGLEAQTGRRLWRFGAAPMERRIPVYGRLASTWPVNSGVLVRDGVAYAAAGIIDYDGTYVCALDAETGKPKWQNAESGHLDKELRKGISAQGFLTVFQDRLWMPGGNVIAAGVYDLADGKYHGEGPGNGTPRCNRGEEIGVFKDMALIRGGRLRYSSRKNIVNPAHFTITAPKYGNKPLMLCRGRIPPAWDDERIVFVYGRKTTPMCCHADKIEEWLKEGSEKARPRVTWMARKLQGSDVVSLVLTPNAVLAVCETEQPRRLETRWRLVALDKRDGEPMWERQLSGPALPGGLAVDRAGRILVMMLDGTLECFGT